MVTPNKFLTMALGQKFVKNLPALFIVNSRVSSTYQAHEKSKFMQKLINKKGAKTRKHWYKQYLGEPLEVEPKKTNKSISHGHSVRLRQLSHVLYDKITEIINSGELSQEIAERQVSIISVKMHIDMNNLSVYWDADRDDAPSVEQLLHAHSGKLRSLLISYHVLGRIPHIAFVKDKAHLDLSQLAGLFAEADYGPDYVTGSIQTDESSELDRQRHQHEGQSLGSCNNEDKVDNVATDQFDLGENILDSTTGQFQELLSEQLEKCNLDVNDPEMPSSSKELQFRSDLYGLGRNELMKKILAKKKTTDMSENKNHHPLSLKFDLDSSFTSDHPSSVLTKTRLKQKLAKVERKLKEKMLERDDFDC